MTVNPIGEYSKINSGKEKRRAKGLHDRINQRSQQIAEIKDGVIYVQQGDQYNRSARRLLAKSGK